VPASRVLSRRRRGAHGRDVAPEVVRAAHVKWARERACMCPGRRTRHQVTSANAGPRMHMRPSRRCRSGHAWDVRDVKVLARPHVDHQRVRASPQRRAQGVRAQALRVGQQVQLRRGRVVGLRARERGIVVRRQRGARDAGRRAARGAAGHLRPRRSGLEHAAAARRGRGSLGSPAAGVPWSAASRCACAPAAHPAAAGAG